VRKFLAAALIAGVFAAPAFAADEYKIMAPAAPGGGWDQTARAMQAALQDGGIAPSVQVLNVPGAGGTIGLAQFVNQTSGDASQLSQLLHNVIGNAMKYGKEGTPILVSLMPEGESMIRLTVTDQGDGIAPEHLPRLTERFYRVDAGRSRTIGGTGLGLSIVKHIVERHRGRFDITSAVGKGSTVTVLLPVQRLS